MTAAKKTAKNAAQKSAKKTTAARKTSAAFTAEEKAAMKARANEVKTAKQRGQEDDEGVVLEKIATMQGQDRHLAERIHAIVKKTAPELTFRLWYGMPAYAKDGKVVFWFKDAAKFKSRYATLGFSDKAALDQGAMWPTEYAITELTTAEEAKLAKLVKQAVG